MKANSKFSASRRSLETAKARVDLLMRGQPNYPASLVWGLFATIAAAILFASYEDGETFKVEEADSDSLSILRTPSDSPKSSDNAEQQPPLLGDSENGPIDDIGTLFRPFP